MDLSQCVLCSSDAAEVRVDGGSGKLTTFSESTSGKLSAFECGPWRWYRGMGEVHMNKGRVVEEVRK
jgi:hypothetical protein